MRLLICLILFATFFYFSFFISKLSAAEDKDSVWYKVDISSDANPIYVDYLSIKRKKEIVKYEQIEFLREKQKLEGVEKEYRFIVSKREVDCENKKYFIKDEKFFDSEINIETDEVIEEMVHRVKHADNGVDRWRAINPDTSLEKVLNFVCLYKDNGN